MVAPKNVLDLLPRNPAATHLAISVRVIPHSRQRLLYYAIRACSPLPAARCPIHREETAPGYGNSPERERVVPAIDSGGEPLGSVLPADEAERPGAPGRDGQTAVQQARLHGRGRLSLHSLPHGYASPLIAKRLDIAFVSRHARSLAGPDIRPGPPFPRGEGAGG